METVGIKVLKNKLSEYVRAASAGQTVQVTDRGRVVAELVAPRGAADTMTAESRLNELVRLGLLTPKVAPALTPLPLREPHAKLAEAMAEVMADLDASRADR